MATVVKPSPAVEHPTVAERVARGKAARAEVPRSSHAALRAGAATRPDPVEAARAPGQDARARARADPLRAHARLAVHLLPRRRADHGRRPRARRRARGCTVQCCGDAHLSNFGVFASPERRLVFDLNDFDETLPGPWEWDVKRLAASMLIAARDNGYAVKDQDRIVLDTVAAYRTAMAGFAAHEQPRRVVRAPGHRERCSSELGSQLTPKMAQAHREGARQGAHQGQHVGVLQTRRASSTARPRIVADPPLIVPLDDLVEGDERDEMFDGAARAAALLPRHAGVRPAGAARGVPRWPTSRARSSASAASARARGSR